MVYIAFNIIRCGYMKITDWVSEPFRQDKGQFHSPRMSAQLFRTI